MVVYVAVIVVIALILLGSYRALGAPSAEVARTGEVLDRLRRALAGTLDRLGEPGAPIQEVAHDARRTGAGVAQELERLGLGAGDAAEEVALRDLLAATADDLAWAGRLLESDDYGGNPGMHDAAAALITHARRCLDEAARLTVTAPEPAGSVARPVPSGAEPADG